MKTGKLTEKEFQRQVIQLAKLCGWRVQKVLEIKPFSDVSRYNGTGRSGATNTTPTLTKQHPRYQRGHVMAEQHSRTCAHCDATLKPSGKNGKYRKTQRFCSCKCARASQVVTQRPATVRVWKHVRKTDGCWFWEGSVSGNGYGHINCGNGRYRPAHVVAYESVRGAVPDGLVLDHLCRNPLCVRPDHLEPVTQKENILRGHAPNILLHLKGVCKRGHRICPENTLFYKKGPRAGRVAFCRVCRRIERDLGNWK